MDLNVGDERQAKHYLFHMVLVLASGPISLERITDKLSIFIFILLFFRFWKNRYNNNNSVNLSALKQDIFLSVVRCLVLNMIGSACLFAQTNSRPTAYRCIIMLECAWLICVSLLYILALDHVLVSRTTNWLSNVWKSYYLISESTCTVREENKVLLSRSHFTAVGP